MGNIGHVFITGQIGNSYDDSGNITEKGVELVDVVEQVQSLGEADAIHVHINSIGGYVVIGDTIAEFLKSIPNVHTIAEGICASIATKIHLSAPLQNRSIQAGCQYMIHNPFLSGVSGDSAKLQDFADNIKITEKALEDMYSKATGLSKIAISGLMATETFLTPEQCVKMNFATKIVEKETPQAIAMMYTNKITEMKKTFLNRAQAALLLLKGEKGEEKNSAREAKALLITTADGNLETVYGDLQVGDVITMEGEPAPDGTYEVSEGEILLTDGTIATTGTTIEVVEGVITVINVPEVSAENKAKALLLAAKAKKEKGEDLNDEEKAALEGEGAETLESLKAKLEASEAKNVELENSLNEEKAEKEEVVKEIEAAAKLGSNFSAPRAAAIFRQKNDSQESTKDKMSEAKGRYKS
jgi:ATP-dependent protease ClpP protease subunit